jgi:hypothetical protein
MIIIIIIIIIIIVIIILIMIIIYNDRWCNLHGVFPKKVLPGCLRKNARQH